MSPTYNGFFLPNRSSKGPYKNCPKQMPIKKLESESDTLEIVVFRLLAIAGKPGRYISIENGPIADNKPSMSIQRNLCFFCIAAIVTKIMLMI